MTLARNNTASGAGRALGVLCSPAIALALASDGASPQQAHAPAAAAAGDDGSWPMAAKNYAATRFSPLNEITNETVRNLQVAFAFSTEVVGGQEAAPIVVDGTMFMVTPFPNHVYALDLTRPGAPIKRIFFNTLDNHTIALEAASGRELWNTKLGEINLGETMTMAPLVVKDKVLVGNKRPPVRRVRHSGLRVFRVARPLELPEPLSIDRHLFYHLRSHAQLKFQQ